MDSKTKILIGVLIVGLLLIGGFLILQNPPFCESDNLRDCDGKKVKIIGIFDTTKGCMGVVVAENYKVEYPPQESVLLSEFVNKCNETRYTNKRVEVIGVMRENKCPIDKPVQCWGGMEIEHIDSIKILENLTLIITTDKTEYEQGEMVKIVIINGLNSPIVPEAILPDKAKSIKFLGENYGIGMIERFENGVWIGIEPVWRCGNSCFKEYKECKYEHSFEPAEKRVFEWNQTMLICDAVNITERVEYVGAGKYRISSIFLHTSAVWLDEEKTRTTFYSNEFTIKDLNIQKNPQTECLGSCRCMKECNERGPTYFIPVEQGSSECSVNSINKICCCSGV